MRQIGRRWLFFIDSLLGTAEERHGRLQFLGRPLVSKLAYFPGTEGRSSIKKVLPALLRYSPYLQATYGNPVYATPQMPSLNFDRPVRWLKSENGLIRDPYELLGTLLSNTTLAESIRRAEEDEDNPGAFIRNGGAAMIAFGQLPQEYLPALERQRLELQLKRYCELDSLAMVMVYQALQALL